MSDVAMLLDLIGWFIVVLVVYLVYRKQPKQPWDDCKDETRFCNGSPCKYTGICPKIIPAEILKDPMCTYTKGTMRKSCNVCGKILYSTYHGLVCVNGHGHLQNWTLN